MEGKDRPVARKAIGFKESKNLPILRKNIDGSTKIGFFLHEPGSRMRS